MKRTILFCALLALLMGVNAQEVTNYKEKHPYKDWVKLAPKLDDAFFATPEAIRIADNVLLYQQTTGGWPKNIYMPAELTADEYKKALAAKDDVNQSTIDNNATSTEIRYLSRIYLATNIEKYKDAALEGIRYILKAQYPNGGWPQFWPRPKGYYTHITYNDNAMVNVMNLLCDVYNRKAPYTYVPDTLCQRARVAFDKGVECILNTQVKQNGKLTVWCAQHDEHTLTPAKARAYELPSLSGAESVNIVLLLMSIPDPSPEIIASVEAAVAWFKANKITGIMHENFINSEGEKDYRMIPCPQDDYPCPVLWARFYTLEDNRPFFCDRDGVKKYDISEIGYERRTGYSWYNNAGLKVLKKYEQWKKRMPAKVSAKA
ncbi:pectate lyase [uncultured Bacteroides sp.]|jgi:pectate lyase|uniref:pectate lyase n=1 Tax=uncultured Bacteroides sp. TaxID=162156 RepID=UPI00280A9C01|nr:pectate lyase [uncultured Bacteroides sp.]